MKKQINEIIEKKFTNISKALIQEQLKILRSTAK